MSCLAAAPDVAPVSMIPILQIAIFWAHFAAVLFLCLEAALVVIMAIVSLHKGVILIGFPVIN